MPVIILNLPRGRTKPVCVRVTVGLDGEHPDAITAVYPRPSRVHDGLTAYVISPEPAAAPDPGWLGACGVVWQATVHAGGALTVWTQQHSNMFWEFQTSEPFGPETMVTSDMVSGAGLGEYLRTLFDAAGLSVAERDAAVATWAGLCAGYTTIRVGLISQAAVDERFPLTVATERGGPPVAVRRVYIELDILPFRDVPPPPAYVVPTIPAGAVGWPIKRPEDELVVVEWGGLVTWT